MVGMHARHVDGEGEPEPSPALHDVARHYDELDDVYRQVWSDHAHHGLWRTGRESVTEAVEALVDLVADAAGVGPASRVVDVGSGYGATGRRLARERSCDVVSFTISPRQYEYARAADAGDPRLRHELRDWLHNGLPDGDRDAAIAVESIGHMDTTAALREVFRVLVPGGRLVIADLVAGDDVPRWQVGPLLRRMERESHLRRLPTAAGLRARLAAAGFEVTEVRDLTTGVRRTWPRAVLRFVRRLPTDRAVRRVLFSDDYENSAFMLSIARMTVGYRLGAVRFVVATARKPSAEPSGPPGSF
jgi:tocopherol O-methyltransferase